MKNNFWKTALCLVLVLISAFAGSTCVKAGNDTVDELDGLIDGITAFKMKSAGVGSLRQYAGETLAAEAGKSAEWYVIALAQSGEQLDFSAYYSSLKAYIRENENISAVTKQKLALCLVAVGARSDEFLSSAADETIGKEGVMSLVFGLHLLKNGCESKVHTPESVAETIVGMQLSDGGWAVTGKVSDADVTAMVLQSLAGLNEKNAAVTQAVEKALTLLSEAQLPGGDFQSFGVPNAESTAQAAVALASLGIDPFADARFVKNGNSVLDGILKYRLPDGSFSHTEGGAYSSTATVQCLCAFVAAKRFYSGGEAFYSLDLEREELTPERGFVPGYKFWVCAGIGAAAAAAVTAVFVRGKSKKNALFIVAAAGICIAAVLFTDIQSRESYYGSGEERGEPAGTVTLEIRCDTIAGKTGEEYIPDSGVVLAAEEFTLYEGDTVYDITVAAARAHGIQMESDGTNYISGIAFIYERQFGDLSGWLYRVNGETPSVGCGEYAPSDGDKIQWIYSCEMGRDID